MAKKWKGYPAAINWIANNDEPEDLNVESVRGFISVCLVADMTGRTTEEVAQDVVNFRKNPWYNNSNSY